MNLEEQNTPIKSANFNKDSKSDGKFIGLIIIKKDAFSKKQEVYFKSNLNAGIAFALKFNINDGEVHIFIGKSFNENHLSNEIFRYDVKKIEREKEYKLEIKFSKWSIDELKINGEDIPNILDKTLTQWDLIQFYSKAIKSGNYIEATSLAYTLIEIELKILLKQKGIGEKDIKDLEYLSQTSRFCFDKGLIDNKLHSRICSFNNTRIDTIHRILDRSVKLREVEGNCKKASSIMSDIQGKWLKWSVKWVSGKNSDYLGDDHT